MVTLLERVQGFTPHRPRSVQRNGASYDATRKFCTRGLKLCKWLYRSTPAEDQTARLIRDTMDFLLRRYHNYAIKENIGAHYRQQGLTHRSQVEFEHVIPAAVVRDLLLIDRLTVNEALDAPTCRLTKVMHARLNSVKLGSSTPDIYWFWQRYKDLDITIETHDGIAVDMTTWNLSTHYSYFEVKL